MPLLTEGEMNITRAYLRGYGDLTQNWNPDLHLAGLKEVFRAGADAGRRVALLEQQERCSAGGDS